MHNIYDSNWWTNVGVQMHIWIETMMKQIDRCSNWWTNCISLQMHKLNWTNAEVFKLMHKWLWLNWWTNDRCSNDNKSIWLNWCTQIDALMTWFSEHYEQPTTNGGVQIDAQMIYDWIDEQTIKL